MMKKIKGCQHGAEDGGEVYWAVCGLDHGGIG